MMLERSVLVWKEYYSRVGDNISNTRSSTKFGYSSHISHIVEEKHRLARDNCVRQGAPPNVICRSSHTNILERVSVLSDEYRVVVSNKPGQK